MPMQSQGRFRGPADHPERETRQACIPPPRSHKESRLRCLCLGLTFLVLLPPVVGQHQQVYHIDGTVVVQIVASIDTCLAG